MVHFITVFASVLSLLSITHAAAVDTRECHEYKCPATLKDGTGELRQGVLGDILDTIKCLYETSSVEDPLPPLCLYLPDDGSLTGRNGPNCPEKADEAC